MYAFLSDMRPWPTMISLRPRPIVFGVPRGHSLATSRFLVACSVFFVAAVIRQAHGEAPKESPGYVLVLEYPESVGDAYRIEAKVNIDLDEHGWAKEKDLGKRQAHASTEVTGTMTILALSKNQRAAKARIHIDALKVTSEGKTVIAAKAGDELILERKDEAGISQVYTATLNAQNLDSDQTRLVSMAFNLVSPSDRSSANRLYNLSGKKKPGESWPVNSQEFSDVLLGPDAKATLAQVKGTVNFLKVLEDNKEQYGLIQIETTSTGFVKMVPGEDSTSKNVKTSCLLHVPLNGKRGTFFTETEQTAKTVSDKPMNADGTPWVLHLDSTTTFKQSLRTTFIQPKG